MKIVHLRNQALIFAITSLISNHSFANATVFPSVRRVTLVCEFSDGVHVTIKAFGDVNPKHGGQGILVLKTFELNLSGRLVSPKKFMSLCSKVIGIKLETIQISRYDVGETPDDSRKLYTLQFDYYSDAFSSAAPSTWENRKKMTVRFDKSGIVEIIEKE